MLPATLLLLLVVHHTKLLSHILDTHNYIETPFWQSVHFAQARPTMPCIFLVYDEIQILRPAVCSLTTDVEAAMISMLSMYVEWCNWPHSLDKDQRC